MTTVAHRSDPEFAALVAAIEALRVQGARAPQPHYEPALRQILGIPAGMPAMKARPYVVKAVLSCASRLEAREGRAFLMAAGFSPAAPRSSGARMKSAAQALGVSERTAYRRVAAATGAIASLLLTAADAPALQERDWAMMRVNLRVDLSDDEPSMVFVQTIRALRDGLDHIDDLVSFPRLGDRKVRIRALEGCSVERWRDLGHGASALTLGFAPPLALDERRRFAISIRLPARDALEPVIGFLPRATSLDANIRLIFGTRHPASLEVVDGVVPVGSFPQAVAPRPLDPDVDDYEHTFARMTPGRSYAVRWTWPPEPGSAATLPG